MMKEAVKPGIYIGLISIIINVLIYLIDATLFAKWWVGLLLIVVSISLVIYFGLQYRNEAGGYLSFKDAYLFCLVMFIVAGAIGTVYSILLFNVIDPNLPKLLTEAIVEQSYNMMKNFGAPEASIDKAIEQIKADTPARFSVVGLLKGFGINIIGAAVISLITGAIVKKKKPELI